MPITATLARRAILAALLLLPTADAAAQGRTRDGRLQLPNDTLPARRELFGKRDALFIGAVAGLTAVTTVFDERIAVPARRSNTGPMAFYEDVGELLPMLQRPGAFVLTGGIFVLGHMADQPDVADMGWHSLEAVTLATGATYVLKGVIGRASPNFGKDTATADYKFFGGFGEFGRTSVPSGHAAIAFAVASSVSAEWLRKWPKSGRIAAPVLYTGATFVALSRLYGNRHWASDLVAGAGVGIYSGLKVVQWSHAHPTNRLDRVMLNASVVPLRDGSTALALSLPVP